MLKRLNAAATVGATVLRKRCCCGAAVRKGCCWFGRLFSWAVSNILVALFDYLRGPGRAVACVCYVCG